MLAGAGSGKTRVITHKIARLLQAGYAPGQIAAITFTNKAAQEMRERARALVGPRAAKQLAISTFHSLGVRLLRAEYARVGLKEQFSILDADDVLRVLKEAGATTDLALARRWQWTIGGWKNQGLTSATAAPATDDERVAQRVMARYEERLAAYQAVDFDDLLVLPLRLLERDLDARERWQGTLRYLLVDEYQDTNAVQYALLKTLAGERGHFTAVGDDDQSIYGWRGATIANLKRLPEDYPALKVIALEQNYRSTGRILAAANAVIGQNPKLFEKKLWSALGDGEPVRVVECDSEEHEAERAVARLQALRGGAAPVPEGMAAPPVRYADFAVLYRANHQAKPFEKALRKANIPYKVSGGQSFFDRAEIKDLCAWLRLLVNHDDDPAFLRAVTTPKRGIGHQTLASLGEFAGRWKTSLYEALFATSLGAVLSGRALGSLHEFGRYLADLEHRARQAVGAASAKALLTAWLVEIDYERHLHDAEESDKLAAARWGNVVDFVDWIAKRCGDDEAEAGYGAASNHAGLVTASAAKSVLEVAQTISVIVSLAERGDDRDVVTLSTLHAAKGLEWAHVVLAGVNEGLLPFRSEDDDMSAERLEEERRLMYVGITRARETLAVSVLRRRKRGREAIAATPSRFVAEMRLDVVTAKEDPHAKLKALREAALRRTELARAAAATAAGSA